MATPYRHTQRSHVLPLILAFTAGFVVLAVFIGLTLAPPTIVLEMPATAKTVLLLVIFAWTVGISILSWYFSSMTVDVTDDELGWRFAGGKATRLHAPRSTECGPSRTAGGRAMGLSILARNDGPTSSAVATPLK